MHIPYFIPFTLQTFVLMLSLCVFGTSVTLKTLCVYTLLGFSGFPVFSSFRGGPGIFLEPTGGYILGFFLAGLFFGFLEKVIPNFLRLKNIILSLLSLIPIYVAATIWYTTVYLSSMTPESFMSAFTVCVLPYILCDVAKATVAGMIANGLKRHITF